MIEVLAKNMIVHDKSADQGVRHVPSRSEQIRAEIKYFEENMPEGEDKVHALEELNKSLLAAELEESL